MRDPFESGLEANAANYQTLTPIGFLARTAAVHPDRVAVIHGDWRSTWAEVERRCHRLASALTARGVGQGDTVAILSPNTPAMFEVHFGVPMTGAVLNTINYRLDAANIGFILGHGEAKVLLVDREYAALAEAALAELEQPPLVIDINDALAPTGAAIGEIDYEALLAEGEEVFAWAPPADEWQAISLNYTSGTTGNPKGVVYHHRGAYLNAIGNIVSWGMARHPVYLWTLPMFHCNGWCFPWTITALAGTHVCLRQVEAGPIYAAIAEHGVTNLCGAPVVMQMITGAGPEERREFSHEVEMMTAAAPPPATVLAEMARQGFRVTHVYGLTETYGPSVVCEWHEAWDEIDVEDQARLKSRQGVPYTVLEGLMVADPETMRAVPKDGLTMGEVFMRGNIVMKGYLKNPAATEEALGGGWFHSGDLGVWHADGYIELKDRSKDIIISGGENISSIEVEDVLYKHAAVQAVAVVAKPDQKWGETPCAFVELKPGATGDEAEIIAFARDNLAHFKCPRSVVFGELPKTSTGKIQKYLLRESVRAG